MSTTNNNIGKRFGGGDLLVPLDDPAPQFWSFLAHLWGWVSHFAFNKVVPPWIWTELFRRGKSWRKRYSNDEDAESSKTGCRSPSRARISRIPRAQQTEELTVHVFQGTAPPLFWPYGSPLLRSLSCLSAPHSWINKETTTTTTKGSPPKYLGNKSEIAHLKFHHPRGKECQKMEDSQCCRCAVYFPNLIASKLGSSFPERDNICIIPNIQPWSDATLSSTIASRQCFVLSTWKSDTWS